VLIRSRTVIGVALLFGILAIGNESFGQVTYPRVSQRQSIEQTIGDTEVRILYHRPNLNGRTGFGDEGAVVPFGKVWRAGANRATLFEFSNDIEVNGKALPKGKYGFYVIPEESDWTIIFNRSWDQWGTAYNEKDDAVRFAVTPVSAGSSVESLTYSIEDVTATTARIVLSWDTMRLPFVIDIGDLNGRILRSARREMVNEPVDAANFVLSNKIAGNYEEAVKWLDISLSLTESYGALFAKSRLLAELGRKQDAVVAGERALEVGKEAKVNPNSLAFLEGLIKQWRSEK
jgi:hypothetical protein